MNSALKQFAIIGSTASGKSDLAIKIAQKMDAYILSIDSLSIYKEIDIVSAKPSKKELLSVKHFGIDVLNPNDYFSVDIFISIYKQVVSLCKQENKNLIIVGGTSFYLKSLIDGLSDVPPITQEISSYVKTKMRELEKYYEELYKLDANYMQHISATDSYRIEKMGLIYEASGITPTEWFAQNPPKSIIQNLDIYNIDVARDILRQRITKRTNAMVGRGLIDEVCFLERKYTRLPHAMNAIGIVEVLEFLDGKVDKEKMIENIALHTTQLAKRQQTFNRTQFENVINAPLEDLEEIILKQHLL